jgi:putative hydrolase of the HAD superfamily
MKRNNTDIRIVLLDIDGVINFGERFSHRYAKNHGVPLATLSQFFDGVFQDCLIGKADLKKELLDVLKEWKWKQSVDALLTYWFLDEVKYDQRVLDTIHKLKKHGVKVYGASNQEHHRAKYLIERTRLKDYIDEFFISAHLGVKKPDVNFYQKVLDTLGAEPSTIGYWDDDDGNVENAKKIGIRAYVFTDFLTFQGQLSKHFPLH